MIVRRFSEYQPAHTHIYGAVTFSNMTFNMTFSIMTFSIMTFSIMTLSITIKNTKLSMPTVTLR